MFHLITAELLCFFAIMLGYTKLRKDNPFILQMVEKLTVYMPPHKEDFETLQRTNKPSRENKKGEKNRYDERKNPKQAKFPMRTMEISPEFLKYCQEFYPEFDFMHMLFQLVLVMFFAVVFLKLIVPDVINTNLTFYLTFLTLCLYVGNMGKNTFVSGYCNLTDETKV